MINIIKHNSQGELKIVNIRTSKYIILYTKNCVIDFFSSNKKITCGINQFIFIDKGTCFSACLQKSNVHEDPYIAIRFNDDKLKTLRRVIAEIYFKGHQEVNHTTISKDKILTIAPTDELVLFFKKLVTTNDEKLILIKTLFFISKFKESEYIIHSLLTSSVSYFSDKVRALIEMNIRRKWCIQDIAKHFHLSESAVRKRLAKENTSINRMAMQIRLNKAMDLITENTLQISQISLEVGISSPSYFIKKFKEHFGVTPKKFKHYFITSPKAIF
ncbi:TPA: helix-turn-helix transcriptional regulator [Escherichia coli]|nr:helix-turn-helix transcriptional regulator [Escherichia coli]